MIIIIIISSFSSSQAAWLKAQSSHHYYCHLSLSSIRHSFLPFATHKFPLILLSLTWSPSSPRKCESRRLLFLGIVLVTFATTAMRVSFRQPCYNLTFVLINPEPSSNVPASNATSSRLYIELGRFRVDHEMLATCYYESSSFFHVCFCH